MRLGEVSKRLSETTRKSTDIPWKEIAGFRDVAIHDYFNMDLDIVWSTIKDDLPALKDGLARLNQGI
jgi:uncharacterized protein with HEPN domain